MRWISWTLLAAVGFMPAFCGAQEAAPDGRQDATVVNESHGSVQAHRGEKGSYLGISAEPASKVLRKQVGLHPGMGLVVRFVVSDSPAMAAGVQEDDLLETLDDQLLVNVQQLAVLVLARHPGEEIKLGVIREGKRLALTAKLSERELEPLSEIGDEEEMAHLLHALPEAQIRRLLPGGRMPTTGPAAVNENVPLSVSMIDGDRTYSITFDANGHQKFIVTDKQGAIVFQGPIDTQAQRDGVPEALRSGLKSLMEASFRPSFKIEQP